MCKLRVDFRIEHRPGVVGGAKEKYALMSEMCGLDRAIPQRDRSADIFPSKYDMVMVTPNAQEVQVWNQLVIIACGAHQPRIIPFPGNEDVIAGIEFLKAVNQGKRPDLADQNVVIIGAGNVGMDIACEAYECGAASVTAVDSKAIDRLEPDGLFLSNGPGDPAAVTYAVDTIRDQISTILRHLPALTTHPTFLTDLLR